MIKVKNEKINTLNNDIESINKNIDSLDYQIKTLNESVNILDSIYFHNISSDINNVLKQLIEKKSDLYIKKLETQNAISNIQNTCNHNWIEYGHDSHHSFYICDKCGKEDNY